MLKSSTQILNYREEKALKLEPAGLTTQSLKIVEEM